jgi:hypothetical protein
MSLLNGDTYIWFIQRLAPPIRRISCIFGLLPTLFTRFPLIPLFLVSAVAEMRQKFSRHFKE